MNPDETVNRDGPKYRRLELPLFDGEDLVGWTFKLERFFNVNGVFETERLDAMGLEGKALNLFQWLETRAPVTSWTELRQGVIRRFHAMGEGDYERLARLKQSGIVLEFRERFEMISATLSDMTEETLMGLYINGLKEEVKAKVRISKPRTLNNLMDIASMVEGRNSTLERARQCREAKMGHKENPMPWRTTMTPPRFSLTSETPRNQKLTMGTPNQHNRGAKQLGQQTPKLLTLIWS